MLIILLVYTELAMANRQASLFSDPVGLWQEQVGRRGSNNLFLSQIGQHMLFGLKICFYCFFINFSGSQLCDWIHKNKVIGQLPFGKEFQQILGYFIRTCFGVFLSLYYSESSGSEAMPVVCILVKQDLFSQRHPAHGMSDAEWE